MGKFPLKAQKKSHRIENQAPDMGISTLIMVRILFSMIELSMEDRRLFILNGVRYLDVG